MLEKRVEALETQGKRIEDALHRIEVRLAESVKQSDFTNISREVGELKGLISGLEKRFSAIPTTWQIIAILATLMIGLFGLFYTANNAANLFQKTPTTLSQPSSQPSPAK